MTSPIYAAPTDLIGWNHWRRLHPRKTLIANNTRVRQEADGSFVIKLYNTDILTFYNDRIEYDTGGWNTYSTKDRMNWLGPLSIFQRQGIWYCRTPNGNVEITDRMWSAVLVNGQWVFEQNGKLYP